MEKLWTPWRMGYVGGPKAEGCIFCDKPAAGDDRANLILHRGADAFVIMNLYPYNTGHVMIVPFAHAATLAELPAAALQEMAALLPWTTALLTRVLRPAGFNVGLNIGEVAGAGVAAHLHMHVVPRWTGDANFMPLLANTTVMPELIPVTQAKLLGEIARTPFPATEDDPAVAEQAGGVPVAADGRVALRRAKAGDWVLPKGHIEAGESAAAAAVREVAEEMGLATRVLDWVGDYRFTHKKARHVGYFLLRVERRLPEFAAHDGADTFFLAPEEAVARLTFENDRAIVRDALARDAKIRAREDHPDA
jgi:ATP adenylyltransferase